MISFANDILPLKNVLYRLALRITQNHEDAEDVVQDTMIRIWNKRDDWEQIENIEAFCLTTCRNLAFDRNKRATHQDALFDEKEAREAQHQANPYDRIIQRDRIDMVRQLMNNLPEKQRTCMQLRDFEGRTYKEIATILALSEEQVKISIHRARQTIKQKFQEAEDHGL